MLIGPIAIFLLRLTTNFVRKVDFQCFISWKIDSYT